MKVSVSGLTAFFLYVFSYAVLYGDPSGTPAGIDLKNVEDGVALSIYGDEAGDTLGLRLASGDINGDGYEDLIMCELDVPREGSGTHSNEVYVLFGSSDIRDRNEIDLLTYTSNVLRIEGEGYWVYLSWPVRFSYPVVISESPRLKTVAALSANHYLPVIRTGNNATLLILSEINPSLNNELLSTGDEIAIFSSEGICTGVGVWQERKNLTITVWGDDDHTKYKDGMAVGEDYLFYIWDSETGETFLATATFSLGDPFYSPHGIVILETLAGNEKPALVDKQDIPLKFSLWQNHPNPFNPVTSISFTLPEERYVTLRVYNTLGAVVATIADNMYSPGIHSVEWDAGGFSSGIYFYTLEAGSFVDTKKLMLMK